MSAHANARGITPPPVYDARSFSYSSSSLKPYLELPHLLSLTWLAYPILSLLFVAFRLQLSAQTAQSSVSSAKADLQTACNAAQTAATSAASLPRYLASIANDGIADAVNDTMDAARDALILALTVMEDIINFIVDTYRSTYLCFLELVVQGALSILISFVQEVNELLTSTFDAIRTGIQDSIEGVNDVIQKIVDEVDKLDIFGDISISNITVPDLSSLENVTLPTDIETALEKLNASLPTLSTLRSDIDDLIDTPFEDLIKDINETFAKLTFDRSVLPVPEQNALTFCDDLDTSWVDDLGNDIVQIAKIGIVILVLLALLLLAANCVLEWYKWRCLKHRLQRTRDAWTSDTAVYHGTTTMTGAPMVDMSDHNLLILQADSMHPHLMKIANALSALLRLSPSQYVNLRWFLHYIFHPPALACFLIGFFGLLSVEIQIIAVRPLADKFSDQVTATVSGYTDIIATSINSSMYNQSSLYANDINSRVDAVQSSINDGLFGWVNTTTTTLNDTINAFYDDIQDAVATVFNGTILESPIEEWIKCFIGSKVNDIEEALTFLHNNLNVNLPTVNESALVLSQSDINEITSPIADAAVGGGDGDSQGIVGDIIDAYIESLKGERIMFGIFMGLWGIVVLMALCIIFWNSYGRDWLEAYRKRKWQKEQRGGVDGLVAPFRERTTGDAALSRGDSLSGQTVVHVDAAIRSPRLLVSPPLTNPALRRSNSSLYKNEKLQPPPRHPMSVRRPELEKSWDSILDNAEKTPAEDRTSLKISRPMRLMAMGRRVMGWSGDEESADLEGRPANRSWAGRLMGLFWKQDEDVEEHPDEKSSMRGRSRPTLTISVPPSYAEDGDIVEEPRVPDQATGGHVPASAWSVSPAMPPKRPWITSLLPTKRPTHPTAFSRPLPPPEASFVPSDEVIDIAAPQPVAPLPVPLHHAFEHPRSPPVPYMQIRSLDPDTSTPVTRHLTTTHARHSSQVVDPFVTPFDDEHSVEAQSSLPSTNPFATPFDDEYHIRSAGTRGPPPSERRAQGTNPFVAMAF